MYNEYYGVASTPTEDYLAHYGVRGMKWGVRKAIARGDSDRLRRNYMKAVKKLGKLSLNANQDVQRKQWARSKAAMVEGGVTSAGLSAGLTAISNSHLSPKRRALLSAAAGLAGGAGGVLLNSKGFSARRYSTDKGHAKAIAKRNSWEKEMRNAFKGTKYGGKQQRQFQKEIMRISDVKDPKRYVHGQYVRARAEANRLVRKKRR